MTETIKMIKKMAQMQGLKQVDIARRTGFTEVSIHRWFTGQREPSIENVERLANALDLKVVITIR